MTESVNPGSKWDDAMYSSHGSFVPALGVAVLDLLDPQPGERILDLGCGDGVLTAEIASRGAEVVGIDASGELVAAAVERGLNVVLGSGERLEFEAEFDAVFSNAALHWMVDAPAVAAGVARALRPGGRFVAEMGGFGNIAAVLTALAAAMEAHGFPDTDPGQFYPTVQQYGQVLAEAGFVEYAGELIPRQTPLAGGIDGWLRTFRQGFLDANGVPADVQELVVADAVRRLEPNLRDVTGNWMADYVRLRFTARIE